MRAAGRSGQELNIVTKHDIIAVLRAELETVVTERKAAKHDPETHAARIALKRFQSDRMARTHADLLAASETKAAATFFLTDLYGPHDLSERDASLQRALPSLERLLPAPALATIAEAVALDALSERLDAEMADLLGTKFDENDYISVYPSVGSYTDRARQLGHVERLGAAMGELVQIPLIGKTLSMMAVPARLAGVLPLQRFLERGFEAFAALKDPRAFVLTVASRERLIMEQLYARKPDPFVLK